MTRCFSAHHTTALHLRSPASQRATVRQSTQTKAPSWDCVSLWDRRKARTSSGRGLWPSGVGLFRIGRQRGQCLGGVQVAVQVPSAVAGMWQRPEHMDFSVPCDAVTAWSELADQQFANLANAHLCSPSGASLRRVGWWLDALDSLCKGFPVKVGVHSLAAHLISKLRNPSADRFDKRGADLVVVSPELHKLALVFGHVCSLPRGRRPFAGRLVWGLVPPCTAEHAPARRDSVADVDGEFKAGLLARLKRGFQRIKLAAHEGKLVDEVDAVHFRSPRSWLSAYRQPVGCSMADGHTYVQRSYQEYV